MLFLCETFARRSLSLAFVLSLVVVAILVFCRPLAVILGVVQIFSCAGFLASANTRAAVDFLATRPISGSQRLRGMILP